MKNLKKMKNYQTNVISIEIKKVLNQHKISNTMIYSFKKKFFSLDSWRKACLEEIYLKYILFFSENVINK